jgi:hypothetical protein
MINPRYIPRKKTITGKNVINIPMILASSPKKAFLFITKLAKFI